MTIDSATSKIINQLIEVIQQLSREDYCKSLNIYNGSTIGKHFRHIHDFYACLLVKENGEIVDYCKRERVEEFENNPDSIVSSFYSIRSAIKSLNPDKEVMVFGDFENENGRRPIVKSSLGREMMYAYDHAVHHLAIIKLGIRAEFPDVIIDDNIGVAASTLKHQLIHH